MLSMFNIKNCLKKYTQQLSNFYRIIIEEFQEFERADQILGQLLSICH